MHYYFLLFTSTLQVGALGFPFTYCSFTHSFIAYFGLFLFEYMIHMYICVFLCVHVYMHMEARGHVGCCPESLPTLFFETGLLIEPIASPVRVSWMAKEFQRPSDLCLPSSGITATSLHVWLFTWILEIWTRVLKLASTLPTELLPQDLFRS